MPDRGTVASDLAGLGPLDMVWTENKNRTRRNHLRVTRNYDLLKRKGAKRLMTRFAAIDGLGFD
jgi:hypothetical protein